MAVKGAPVIITTKNGIPVRPVESGGPLLTVTDNGIGAPITISERGAPFVVGGIGPSIYQEGPLYIAHRMSGMMYPEFSNDSYQWGYDAGLRQFEIDARFQHPQADECQNDVQGYGNFAIWRDTIGMCYISLNL